LCEWCGNTLNSSDKLCSEVSNDGEDGIEFYLDESKASSNELKVPRSRVGTPVSLVRSSRWVESQRSFDDLVGEKSLRGERFKISSDGVVCRFDESEVLMMKEGG
jgi:hypothetical protein